MSGVAQDISPAAPGTREPPAARQDLLLSGAFCILAFWANEQMSLRSLSPVHNNPPWQVRVGAALLARRQAFGHCALTTLRATALHQPLPDVLHARLPLLDHTDPKSPYAGLPDMLVGANAACTLAFVLVYSKWEPLLAEFFKLYGILLILRATTVGATTLPSPVPGCWGRSTGSGPVAVPGPSNR